MKYLILLGMASFAWTQQLDLSRLDSLSSKAREVASVDLDAEKLKLASGLVTAGADEHAKQALSQMKGVFVRVFQFDNTGAYTDADLQAVRSQLTGPSWNRIVQTKAKDEQVEVWFHTGDGKIGGIAVIAGKPKELAVVNVIGLADLASLMKLGSVVGGAGALGQIGNPGAKKPAPAATEQTTGK